MSGQVFDSAFMDELKKKNDIVSVISRYVTLERKGKNYWGRCPFHHEKTPSFSVNEIDQFYHCFGCKESGDVVHFIEKIESVDFMDAVKILADWAHMEVPQLTKDSHVEELAKKKKRLVEVMRECARYYHDNLSKPQAKPATDYLKKRGIELLATRFGLGYSLGFTEIINYAKTKNITLQELKDAGILKEKDGRAYDAVGGRLLFPIINLYGEVVAFGGRTLKQQVDFAKYLNTAETMLFSKSKNLYAINLLKKKKQTAPIDYVIVVEGNIDVISLHKAGFDNAIASMGTALTVDQAKLIKRFSDNVFICYDGDTAGKKATIRGLDILKEQGLNVRVVSLPEGMDPDDIIQKQGKEAYQRLLDSALPLVEFKLASLKEQFDMTNLDGKTKYVESALKVLSDLSSEVERETYLDYVQNVAGISKDFLRRQISWKQPEQEKTKPDNIANVIEPETDAISTKAQRMLLSCLFHQKPYAKYEEIKEYIDNPTHQQMLDFLKGEKYTASQFLDKFDSQSGEVGEIVNFPIEEDEQIAERQYQDCMLVLKKAKLETRQKEINDKLKTEIDRDKARELLQELSTITKERSRLK